MAADPESRSPVGASGNAGGARAGAPARGVDPPARDVLEGARRREPAALNEFFECYVDPVHALAHRLLGRREAAEDVTQDVFLKVHRAIDQLDPARDPWPWLATIVHNACRDVWRSGAYRLSRRSEALDGDAALGERLPSRAASPEGELLAAERERLVREAIAELPEPLREAVLLYDYRGLSHLDVAELLGIGHAAARKRYSRALDALAKLLDRRLGPAAERAR